MAGGLARFLGDKASITLFSLTHMGLRFLIQPLG